MHMHVVLRCKLRITCRDVIQEDLYLMTTDGKQTWLSAMAASNIQRVDFREKLGRTLAGAGLDDRLSSS